MSRRRRTVLLAVVVVAGLIAAAGAWLLSTMRSAWRPVSVAGTAAPASGWPSSVIVWMTLPKPCKSMSSTAWRYLKLVSLRAPWKACGTKGRNTSRSVS